MLTTESGWYISPVLGDGNIHGLSLIHIFGVGVQFEEDGVNTLAMADEMLLNTFAAIAQEESKSISQNQRLSIVKRMESCLLYTSHDALH